MNEILEKLSKNVNVKKIAQCIKNNNPAIVYGLADSLKVAVFSVAVKNKPMIVITPDQQALNVWHEDLISLCPNVEICTLPELDFFEVHAVAKSLDLYANLRPCKNIEGIKTKFDNVDLSFIKYVISGGDYLTESLEEKMNNFLRSHGANISIGKGYGMTSLKNMRKFYVLFSKSQAVPDQLTWSHYIELLKLDSMESINYYIGISLKDNLSYRKLHEKIKNMKD